MACGLASAAFCDTFDAPSANRGRAGELDATRWSASHTAPQLPSGGGVATAIGPATIGACRSGLPAQVYPSQDALVCSANANIASPHLLVAVAAQNYGQNSYRIRQPFDFSGRTGKIVFDANASTAALIGWISVEVVEDPTNAPSFIASIYDNDEDGSIPKNGFELQLQSGCSGDVTRPDVGLRMLMLYNNYKSTTIEPQGTPVCVNTKPGHLNHMEVEVSQQKISIWATPYSADGKSFGTPALLYSAAVTLPFSRGYVSITTHNHASEKYSSDTMDAWISRWDNVGFDGPVINKWREYEVADSLTPGTAGIQATSFPPRPVVSIGYRVDDAVNGPAQTLHLRNVNLDNAVSARLSLSAWYLVYTDFGADPPKFVLRYRFNGKAWHDRKLTAGELAVVASMSHGQLSQMLDVPLSDLVSGDNTLEFVTVNVPQSYPPLVANIDLVLETK
jgi:hypothetical protein